MSGSPLTLAAVLEVEHGALSTRAAGDDRVPVAISSEHPVERIDYLTGRRFLEVLDHAPSSVDLSRASRGLPFLLAHGEGDQFGVVEEVRVGSDRKLRGMVRFSRSPRAQELRQDILDGIRSAVSVGYIAGDEFVTEETRDGKTVRRFTRWTPYEVSTVPIPADPTVGVNRRAPAVRPHSSRGTLMHDTDNSDHRTDEPSLDEQFQQIAEAANRSVAEMRADRKKYRTVEEYGAAMLRRMTADFGHGERTSVNVPRTSSAFEDAFAEAIFAPKGERAEKTTRELAKELGIATQGVLVPLARRTLTSFTAGAGAEFSPTIQGDIVDLMRPRMVSAEFGAKLEYYAGSKVSRPKITSDAVYTWLSENPTTGVAASDLGTGSVDMAPRAVATRTTHTQQSLRTSTPEISRMIQMAHAARLAVAADAAVLAGAGGAAEPVGILNTVGVNIVAMGTNGAPVSYAKLCELEESIDLASAPMEGLGFVTTPRIRSRMRQTQDFPTASAGRPLWDSSNTVLGHRAMTTTSMPASLTKGSSNGVCHSAILGDFTQAVVAYWGALEVLVDPYTDAAKGLVHITSLLYLDVGIIQPGAFAVIRDLTLS